MPWALKQLEEDKVETDTWSEDFNQLKSNMFEQLTENRKELVEDFLSYLSDTQTLENLQEIQSLIIRKVKWVFERRTKH